MDLVEVKKITNIDSENFKIITDWMYNWWGKTDGDTLEEVECFVMHTMQNDRIPQTYGIFLNNKIIGMYQFLHNDLKIRPDIYPWLADVYIDEKYRQKGFARIMLETVKNSMKDLNLKEIYLYTEYVGFYEKLGWDFVSEIDTYKKKSRIQRLYKMKLE